MNRILIWEGSRNIHPLMMIFSIKKKTSHTRKEGWFYTTIKTQKPSTHKVHIIHPSSGTLELWEVLTWPLEDIRLAPHRCSLLCLLFLYCVGVVSSMWEPRDLLMIFRASSVGVVCGKARSGDKPYSPLFGQKVAWYFLVRWQPPPTIKATNRNLLPWRGKSKPSQQQ